MGDESEYRVTDFSKVRVQLDEILVEQISRLIEIDLTAAALSFNLATISCLLLLVEREREIQKPHGKPPERYDMDSFIADLAELGLETDDDLLGALQSLAQCGYVEMDNNGRYSANISAFTLVAFLDNLFPGMKGLNLVGYVMQTITEVVTGRRAIEDAKKYLKQTLFAQGASLSKQSFGKSQEEKIRHGVNRHNDNPQLAADIQKSYLGRLEKLRAFKDDASEKPAFISRYGGVPGGNIKIREVFPKNFQSDSGNDGFDALYKSGDEKPDSSFRKEETGIESSVSAKKTDVEKNRAEVAIPEDSGYIAEKETAGQTDQVVRYESAKVENFRQEIKPEAENEHSEIINEPEKISESAVKESEIKVLTPSVEEEPLKQSLPPDSAKTASYCEAEEEIDNSDEPDENEIDDDEIERRIAAFADDIAIACPVCGTGKVRSSETEKGRVYYRCSSNSCNFVSWSKPYHFACPLCSNSYLVEFQTAEGHPGLKCPRATCSYSQSALTNPVSAGSAMPFSDAVVKKKKLVRRVKKKP